LQQDGWQQVGWQHLGWQQLDRQQWWWLSSPQERPQLLQPLLQPLLQLLQPLLQLLQPLLQPQLGRAAQQVGAAAALQPQVGVGAAAVQQLFATQPLLHAHPFDPSIRSSKSNAKLWVQSPRPSTNDPTIMFHFIVPRLLNTVEPTLALLPFIDRRELSCS